MDFTSRICRPLVLAAGLHVALCLLPSRASSQVTEPNGISVPGEPEHDTEVPLWAFFEAEGESIDAVATASIAPGTFSPRCDFEATLVLSESQASAGLAWYNVPDDANQAPDEIYELVAPTTETGTVITSADILTSPNYAGGLIGFALTKYTDTEATSTAGGTAGGGADPDSAPGAAARGADSGGCACTLINHTPKLPGGFGMLLGLWAFWARRHTPASGSRRPSAV